MTIPQGKALLVVPSNLGSRAERWTLQRSSVLWRVSARHGIFGKGFPMARVGLWWDNIVMPPPVWYFKTFQVGHDSRVVFHPLSFLKGTLLQRVSRNNVTIIMEHLYTLFEQFGTGRFVWHDLGSHWEYDPVVQCFSQCCLFGPSCGSFKICIFWQIITTSLQTITS